MNIIFIDEDDVRGYSMYIDPETMDKEDNFYLSPMGIYRYYFEGNQRGTTIPLPEPFPCVFL